MNERIVISTGTNVGEKKSNLIQAQKLLEREFGVVSCASQLYKSSSWGFEGSDFLNQIVIFETDRDAKYVMNSLLKIEADMGRERKVSTEYYDRLIDLDLIYYGGHVYNEKALIVPHPRMHKRNFVLQPLLEVCDECIHPVFQLSTKELLQNCEDEIEAELWI